MRQLKKKEIKKLSKEFKRKNEIYVVAENIAYARNVASIFRICDAAGVRRLYITGSSHTPPFGKELQKVSRSKEKSLEWMYVQTSGQIIQSLKKQGFVIVAIELTDDAIELKDLKEKIADTTPKIAFVVGSEVNGIYKTTLEKCDSSVLIPMYGKGASLNVSSSLAVALYSL